MSKEAWTFPLSEPVTLPDGTQLTSLKFPRMKGKYMRKFQMRVQQGDVERARAGEDFGVSMTINFEDFINIGVAMLTDEHGPVSARYIFDELSPADTTEVVGRLGELFAGGRPTGRTS